MPLVELWDNVAFLNLRDLCRWKEGLPVLLVAHGGVLVPPYHQAMEHKKEVGLAHGVQHLLVPGLQKQRLANID